MTPPKAGDHVRFTDQRLDAQWGRRLLVRKILCGDILEFVSELGIVGTTHAGAVELDEAEATK